MKTHKDNYFMNTHFLNDFNEVHNTNNYLNEKSTVENERLQSTHDRMRSQLLKMKQEMLMKNYATTDFAVKSNLLYTALVVACFILILVILFTKEMLGRNMLIMITLIVLVAFTTLVFFVVKANAYRVDTNWDMYHWGPATSK
jgi:ABC-type transport system involved in cytochrome bd biosynthesis fused ATPase/permease subunit